MRIDLATVAAMVAVAVTPGAYAQVQWKHVTSLGDRHFVLVEPSVAADEVLLKQAAAAACVAADRACIVAFWSNAAAVPSAMPMTKAQQQAVVAQYMRNPVSGKEELLLRCRLPTNPAGAKCLR